MGQPHRRRHRGWPRGRSQQEELLALRGWQKQPSPQPHGWLHRGWPYWRSQQEELLAPQGWQSILRNGKQPGNLPFLR